MVHSEAPPRKMASTQSQSVLSFIKRTAPEVFSGVCISGMGVRINKIAAVSGTAVINSTSHCQYSLPSNSKNAVATTTMPTTPQAYTECSLLISLSGFSAGIAAMTGLISTSQSPLAAQATTVPSTKPRYTAFGNSTGASAISTKPAIAMMGVSLTVSGILNLCEKNEKMRSTVSWVKKLISTSVPKSEYEMPYCSWKVKNKSGGRLPITLMVTLTA